MKYKDKIVDGHKVYFSADWINNLEQEIHFNWYYHQANLVYSNCSREQKIIEIGIGTGLLSDLLKKRGWDVKTLDIDNKKNPDFCDSAGEFNYSQHSTQVILAFEIFEHIPLPTFKKVISKLAKDNVRNIYFSLPWNERRIIDLNLKLPKLPTLRWNLSIPHGKIETHAHFWELGNKEKIFKDKQLVTIESLKNIFSKNGYRLSCLKKVGNIQYFSAQKVL